MQATAQTVHKMLDESHVGEIKHGVDMRGHDNLDSHLDFKIEARPTQSVVWETAIPKPSTHFQPSVIINADRALETFGKSRRLWDRLSWSVLV